ncbi:hypothetical protein EXIGLDRAFT_156457 [Exidia glandulosa HHB12029]|uniref:SGNH hydrolase-type esterase domain-containing protein n=1 Tax=Exidia glandulosa HHB12029 TaxID=1314781 RepID=A0A165N897_EXIGL|nr:hypothetical protein EXIGLDRAFT_156457 [Exidia glandulosa HHB12029]
MFVFLLRRSARTTMAGINDYRTEDNMRNIESILRAVLSYPSKPAIIFVAWFSLMDRLDIGADIHVPVAQYYDVPYINVRHALLPIIQRYPETLKDYFVYTHPDPKRIDLLHATELGHRVLAESTIAFLERQRCLVENPKPYLPANTTIFPVGEEYDLDIPRLSLMGNIWTANTSIHGRIDSPTCSTIDSVRAPLTPLPSTRGWTKWRQPHTEKWFWRATQVGAQIDFDVQVAEGNVQVYHLRSRSMGLGRVKCWLDEDETHARMMDGWWDDPTNVGHFTTANEGRGLLEPGKYQLHCRVVERHPGPEKGRGTTFLIIAILTI